MRKMAKEVYSPPKIFAVSFEVVRGFNVSMESFGTQTWDDDMPGSQTNNFGEQEWRDDGGGSNTITSFESYEW